MISHAVEEMQPSNCLLCGELDELGDNVTAFGIVGDISIENARRVCKLLKLPYQDNTTVLKGLRTCNFCRDCKNDIVKFDSFVGQLEGLKSKVDDVKERFMAQLQSAQAGSYGVCSDETALKTAEGRQYLRDCLGIFKADDDETAELESNGFNQAQDDDDDEDEGFSFKIVDVRGGIDVEFSQDESQEVEADEGLVRPQTGDGELNGSTAVTEIALSLQDQFSGGSNPDLPQPFGPKAGVSGLSHHKDTDTAVNTQDGWEGEEDLDADDSADLMDLENQFLVPPDLSDDEEENEKSMVEDPLKIFDDDYECEAMPNEEPEVSRASSEVETGYQFPTEWYQQDTGFHFLVQDQTNLMRSNLGQSLLKCNLARPQVSPEPKFLNWTDLKAAVSPSCYKIHEEPDGTKKLKLTGKMTFAEIKRKVAEYREKRRQEVWQEAHAFSGSGSESSFNDSASTSPTELLLKQGRTRYRGIPHQNNERKRRAELANSFEHLRKLVPSLSMRRGAGFKYSKVSILLGATEYCGNLKSIERQQMKELAKLEAKRNDLKKKLGFHQLGSIVTNPSITVTSKLSTS